MEELIAVTNRQKARARNSNYSIFWRKPETMARQTKVEVL